MNSLRYNYIQNYKSFRLSKSYVLHQFQIVSSIYTLLSLSWYIRLNYLWFEYQEIYLILSYLFNSLFLTRVQRIDRESMSFMGYE